MTAVAGTLDSPSLRRQALGRPMLGLAAAAGVAVAGLLAAAKAVHGPAESTILASVLGVAALVATSWIVEGRRVALDRMVTVLAWSSFVIAMIPLGLLIGYVVARGLPGLSAGFLTHSQAHTVPSQPGGGAYHAIVGTVEQVGLASLVSVPLGLLVAIYLVEYGRGGLARTIRFFVDVMTGIPSIVAGLFIYSFWVIGLGLSFSGLAGALALSVLMIPIVVRSCEEMLQLVPHDLREASYALGVPRWRTILSVVLPTAAAGITTGIMLAVARVTGETAPLILTVFGNQYIHLNPFQGRQDALSLFVYGQAGQPYDAAVARAWTGALTLILIVLLLYVVARLVTRHNTLARR